ncbi:MAG: ABC-2 family transporter protein [Microgenomates group bacterium]
MKKILRYTSLAWQFILFRTKSLLEYRINFVIQLFHGPAYVGMMFGILSLAFDRAGELQGWTKMDGILLFLTFQFLYLLGIVIFLKGVRHFLWEGLRRGELDMMLTKPINTQFIVTLSKPEIEQVPLLTAIFVLFVRHMWLMWDLFTFQSIALFSISFLLGLVLMYLSSTTFMTLGFKMTRATQIIELFDKSSDFAQYPTSLFPASIQWFAFAIIPVAFFGYVPVSFLLGKELWWYLPAEILLVLILTFINQKAWKEGLKHYSSASS